MKKVFYSLFFLLILFSTKAKADGPRYKVKHDSLVALSNKVNDKHEKALLYMEIAELNTTNHADISKPYLDKAFELAEQHHYNDVLARAYYLKAFFTPRQDVKLMDEYMDKSLKMAELAKDSFTLFIVYEHYTRYAKQSNEPNKALEYLKKMKALTANKKVEIKTGIVYENIARIYWHQSKADSTRKYCELALKLPMKKIDANTLGDIYKTMGDIVFGEGKLNGALNYYKKADSIFASTKDLSGKTNIMLAMAQIYIAAENYKQAKEVMDAALPIFDDPKNHNLNPNGANARILLGAVLNELGQYDEAEKVFLKGIDIAEKYQLAAPIGPLKNNLGETYLRQKKYLKAYGLLEDSYKIDLKEKNYYNVLISAPMLMECNFYLGKHKENIEITKSLLPLNKEKDYEYHFIDLYVWGQKSYIAQNNYKDAYHLKELQSNLTDSVLLQRSNEKTLALMEEYKTKMQADQIELLKKEKQITELTNHKKTTTIYALIGGIALIILLALLIVRQLHLKRKIAEEKRKSEEQKALQFRLKALSAQMNPHFIFNALNSIQHFISNNDIKSSKEYLAKFAKLMRKTLDNSTHDTIPLDQELEALTEYMELEKIRTSNQFNYQINIDPNLQSEQVEVPPLLFQPYVENAIWHGIAHKMNSDGLITITLTQKDGKLGCTIEDNGIGVKKSRENTGGKHKSLGTSITQTRVDLLNSMEENQIAVKVTDKSELNTTEQGTRIELTLPIN